ncbi:5-fold beta-flower protein [Mucilaginibacter aquariorum]|uniref:WG repeat-containing protein n=1 Tax=Mucilaginibacter aquariorum TaxID=2967225 RepID=A0ABT1T8W9_9SPHI|nr:hypothetical protein [Mucilaginibacter aquariorum]MCQ6961061.1 hypothetical protein [Mucilaginibacter aquariorum]
MKKLKLLTTSIAIIVFAASAFAQKTKDSTRYNFITIDGKGGIHDHGGTKLGYIDKNNIVRNNKGQKLYFIDREGNVISADGTKLGKAKKNGDYYNNDGQIVLQLKNPDAERCEILDPKGHSQGYVHRNYKLHACAAHCYWLEQAKLKKEKEKTQ